MPPKHVGKELRELIKKVRDGTFEYTNREEAGTNWAKYDYAQIHEMANYLDNLREIVNEADNRIRSRTIADKRGPGRPPTDPKDDSFPIVDSASNRGFSYCVMGVGVRHKLISGISVSPDHSIGETTLFPDAYYQTIKNYPNLENVLGDGIYACRWITDLVSKSNVIPYFLPKSNVTFQSKGFAGWYDMLFSLWNDPQKWLEQYHIRSISETVNSMVKCRFGATLRKKLDPRKATETKLKLVAHDIRRIGYIEILNDIKPVWTRNGV